MVASCGAFSKNAFLTVQYGNAGTVVISWRLFLGLFYLYRCVMAVAGELVIRRLTTLGDASTYQRSVLLDLSASEFQTGGQLTGLRQVGTLITLGVGGTFNIIFAGNPILINIGFQTIAFIGIVKLLNCCDDWLKRRLALLLLFPSFNLWSSVASKEAIVVFLVCVISAYMLDIYYNRDRLTLLTSVSVVVLAFFKVHFMAAVVFVLGILKVASRFREKAALAVTAGLLSLAMLYVVRDKIASLSLTVQIHFRPEDARSTREIFFAEPYDVFLKAPYGMFQTFFGPTISEVITSPVHVVSFAESFVLLAILSFYLLRRLPELPAFPAIVGFFTTAWLMFGMMPFGIHNPGSAIRYRTGYYVLICVLFLILTSRDRFRFWRAGHVVRRRQPRSDYPATR